MIAGFSALPLSAYFPCFSVFFVLILSRVCTFTSLHFPASTHRPFPFVCCILPFNTSAHSRYYCPMWGWMKPGSINGLCWDKKVGQFSINAIQTYFCVTKSPEPAPRCRRSVLSWTSSRGFLLMSRSRRAT